MLCLIGFSTNKTWLPVNPNYKVLNLKKEMKSSRSHYNMYKQLVEARKQPVIQNGSLNINILPEDVFSFSR
jgi:alpha-glucosidase